MAGEAFRYEAQQDVTFEGALLVVAFPSPGFVSQVAARYLVTSQRLPLVGAFRSGALGATVAVENGVPLPPIRVYVGAQVCGLDKSCDQLAVLISDVVPPEAVQCPLATTLLDWARDGGVSHLFVLEGMSRTASDADEPAIRGTSPNAECRGELRKRGIESLDSVLVSGMTAALLDEGGRRPEPCVVGLFVEAHNQFRDAAAAAALVEALNKFLLHIPIDAGPLRETAEQLTAQVRKAHDSRAQWGALAGYA